MSLTDADTIVALATPPGRSGIGVVRLSGPASLRILQELTPSNSFPPDPNVLSLRNLVDPSTGAILDEAMVCYFKAPHSFTGEDVVEFQCHGSPILLRAIVDAVLKLDARMADPGEFSLRAVANGRMNLAQAEAIRDLIDAQTEDAARQATRQLKGAVAETLRPVKDQLVKMIVRLESSLEFVEDDLPELEQNEILKSLQSLRAELNQLAATFSRGRLIRDGIRVTFVGRPNAGKSSLFNSLLGHARSIVTATPGTTRDTITESIALKGIPLVLTDTAGLREAGDHIESIGVDRTRREAADSDLLIVVVDGSQEVTDEDRRVILDVANRPHVIALNKCDLPTFSGARAADLRSPHEHVGCVAVSAKDATGIEDLQAAIIHPFTNGGHNSEGLLITNARHHDLLLRTIEAIESSEKLLCAHTTEEVIVVDLHNALRYLGEITGETTSDQILGEIFSTFCIGK